MHSADSVSHHYRTVGRDLVRTNMQVEAGVRRFFTDNNFEALNKLITDCWMKGVWSCAASFKIHIKDKVAKLSLACKDDAFLMTCFIVDGNYKNNELKQLCECQMFLKALSVVDLAIASGDQLTRKAAIGEYDPDQGSNYQWPQTQKSLPASHWELSHPAHLQE